MHQPANLVYVLSVVFMLSSPVSLAADRFVSGIADLPLMNGLEEIDGSAMVFSTPEGRIVEVMAKGAVSIGAVHSFYDRTLLQLGWRQESEGVWKREGERLRLEVTDRKDGVTMRFSLTPQ